MFAMLTDHSFLHSTMFSVSCFVIQQLSLFSHGLFLSVSAVKILFVLFMHDHGFSFNQSSDIINQLSGSDKKKTYYYWTWSLVIAKFILAMDERYHGHAILTCNHVPTAFVFFILVATGCPLL